MQHENTESFVMSVWQVFIRTFVPLLHYKQGINKLHYRKYQKQSHIPTPALGLSLLLKQSCCKPRNAQGDAYRCVAVSCIMPASSFVISEMLQSRSHSVPVLVCLACYSSCQRYDGGVSVWTEVICLPTEPIQFEATLLRKWEVWERAQISNSKRCRMYDFAPEGSSTRPGLWAFPTVQILQILF